MKKLEIIRLTDSCECETCGTSYADGYSAYLDGDLLCEVLPAAHCFDGTSVDDEEMYQQIFAKLGYEFGIDKP